MPPTSRPGDPCVPGMPGAAPRRRPSRPGSLLSPTVPDESSSPNDLGLLGRLHGCAGTIRGRLAVAVVDRDVEPPVRRALVRASAVTPFEIGSITKALTGMLLADAVGHGRVTTTTTVGEIVPAVGGSELASVSLLELATHTSGLPRMPHGWSAAVDALPYAVLGRNPYRGSPDRVIELAARQPLHGRGRRRYSNIGGAVLGEALAASWPGGYPALLEDRILGPLGMASTRVSVVGDTAPWGRASFGLPREPWVMGGYAPAGGLVSNLDDLVRLVLALLDGSAPGRDALDPLRGVPTDRPNRMTGLCWMIDGPPDQQPAITWHDGGTGGYSSFLALMPDTGRGVVTLQSVAGRSGRLREIALALTG